MIFSRFRSSLVFLIFVHDGLNIYILPTPLSITSQGYMNRIHCKSASIISIGSTYNTGIAPTKHLHTSYAKQIDLPVACTKQPTMAHTAEGLHTQLYVTHLKPIKSHVYVYMYRLCVHTYIYKPYLAAHGKPRTPRRPASKVHVAPA